MSEKNFDVFISHSSKDALAASAIKQHLQGVGIRCWKAPDDIMPGESWPQAILRALGNCHAMVLVWSSNSTTSGEVSKELTLAMRNNITVVPFRIEDVKASGEWEYHLANTHWMDAFAGDMENHFSGLTSYLRRVLPVRETEANVAKNSGAGTLDQKDKSVSMNLFDTLIESALQDGVISDEEMGVLVSRAETLGINKSELDLILKAKLAISHVTPQQKITQEINCPECNSKDVIWKSRAEVWECSKCEERFISEATLNTNEIIGEKAIKELFMAIVSLVYAEKILDSKIGFPEKINETKLKKFLSSSPELHLDEADKSNLTPLILLDDTVFGGNKEGFLLHWDRIVYKNLGAKKTNVFFNSLECFKICSSNQKSPNIIINEQNKILITQLDVKYRPMLVELLNNILKIYNYNFDFKNFSDVEKIKDQIYLQQIFNEINIDFSILNQ